MDDFGNCLQMVRGTLEIHASIEALGAAIRFYMDALPIDFPEEHLRILGAIP